MRAWVEKRTGFASNFDIRFYPGAIGFPPWPGPRLCHTMPTLQMRPVAAASLLACAFRAGMRACLGLLPDIPIADASGSSGKPACMSLSREHESKLASVA